MLSLLLLAGTSMVLADTQIQFVDAHGNLITNATVIVTAVNEAGVPVAKATLPPDADGTYSVPVNVGQKVNFKLQGGASPVLRSGATASVKIATNQNPQQVVVTPQGTANDLCTGAQPIAIGSTTSDTTLGATPDGAPVCGAAGADTAAGVWFSVTGDGTTLKASTCEASSAGSSNYDTKISVYCPSCAAPICVAGNDDDPACTGATIFHSTVTWCSQATGSYLILVHGFGASAGNFGLNLTSNGTSCTATVNCLPPPPMGACCVTSECPFEQGEVPVTCSITTPTDCAAAGGVYQGDNSVCVVPVNQVDLVANPALAIPDNTPAGVNNTINVATSLVIADVNVDIGINHTWVSDLVIAVTHGSTTQVLWNQVCGSTDNINATADDEGTETFCAPINAGPIDSVFFPPALAGDGPLSVFDGQNALGAWTINVSDHAAQDVGTLNQWSLHFIEGAPQCAAVPCPTGGGTGGAGGSGGCDEDEDEGGDGHEFVEAEGAGVGTAPIDMDRSGHHPGEQSSDKGDRSHGRLRGQR